MSGRSEVERFASDVANNAALYEELKAFGSDQEAVVRHANAKGYNFTMDDVKAISSAGELTDTQLEGVAGGIILLSEKVMTTTTTLSGSSTGFVFTIRTGSSYANLVW